MWAEYIHHLTLHFTIVMPMVLAAAGLYAVRREVSSLEQPLRWGGFAALGFAVLTAVSGLIAGDVTGGEESLQHHRYLGMLTLLVIALAAIGYHRGVRRASSRWRAFGVGVWWVASFSVIGAGHYGGLVVHADAVPL